MHAASHADCCIHRFTRSARPAAGAEGSQNWEAHLNDQDVGKPHGQLDCLAAGQQLVARQFVGPLQHIIRHLLRRQQLVHHAALQSVSRRDWSTRYREEACAHPDAQKAAKQPS